MKITERVSKNHKTNTEKKVMTYVPPSCDGPGVKVFSNTGELVLSTCVVGPHGPERKMTNTLCTKRRVTLNAASISLATVLTSSYPTSTNSSLKSEQNQYIYIAGFTQKFNNSYILNIR